MTESLESKLAHLEMLYTEQENIIQTLNDVVAEQDQEITRLNLSIERIQSQLKILKSELSDDINPAYEKPPHY
ncbi:MAG: SlyX family protein [Pseudomonadota bacterium]